MVPESSTDVMTSYFSSLSAGRLDEARQIVSLEIVPDHASETMLAFLRCHYHQRFGRHRELSEAFNLLSLVGRDDAMRKLALAWLRMHDLKAEESADLAEEAGREFNARGERRLEVEAILQGAAAYSELQIWDKATNLLLIAEAASEDLGLIDILLTARIQRACNTLLSGDPGTAKALLDSVGELVRSRSVDQELAFWTLNKGYVESMAGDYTNAQASLREALRLAEACDDRATAISAMHNLMGFAAWRSDFPEFMRYTLLFEARLVGETSLRDQAICAMEAYTGRSTMGDYKKSRYLAVQIDELIKKHPGNLTSMYGTYFGTQSTQILREHNEVGTDRFLRETRDYLPSMPIHERMGLLCVRAELLATRGRFDEAESEIDEADALDEKLGGAQENLRRAKRGRVYFAAGRLDEAKLQIEKARQLYLEKGGTVSALRMKSLLGLIMAKLQDFETSSRLFDESLEEVTSLTTMSDPRSMVSLRNDQLDVYHDCETGFLLSRDARRSVDFASRFAGTYLRSRLGLSDSEPAQPANELRLHYLNFDGDLAGIVSAHANERRLLQVNLDVMLRRSGKGAKSSLALTGITEPDRGFRVENEPSSSNTTLADVIDACFSASDDEARSARRMLHDLLIAPFEPEISKSSSLVIMPQGPLFLVPFATLEDQEGRSLAERITLRQRISPLLGEWHDRAKRKITGPALAIGGAESWLPDLAGERGNSAKVEPLSAVADGSLSESRKFDDLFARTTCCRFPALPKSADEALDVAGSFPRGKALLGAGATKDGLFGLSETGELGAYQVVHFALHAFVSRDIPELSAFVLSPGAGGDRLLRKSEIEELKMDADLVVLSGCSTGHGEILHVEGIFGLLEAFMIAGARSMIVSLAPLGDSEAASFMKTFYGRLSLHGDIAKSFGEAIAASKEEGRKGWRYFSYYG